MHKYLAALAAILVVLLVPSLAEASYYIDRSEANWDARQLARQLYYADYGVTFNAAHSSCRPQGRPAFSDPYTHHRWVCGWVAYNADSDMVGGAFLIAGQSDGSYRYAIWKGIRLL